MPMGVMYLHARTFVTLTDTTSIPIGAMYLHARMFCTLAYMTFIPLGAMYFMQELSVFSDTILYRLWAPVFTVITEVWPSANRAVVTNNLTFKIEVFCI